MHTNASARRGLIVTLMLGIITVAGCPGPERKLVEQSVERFSGEPKLSFFSHKTNRKSTIPLEYYMAGVVAGEMKPRWPKNAYAAQAIVARTFTLELLSRGGTRDIHGTDICDDPVHAQAYNAEAATETVRDAVRMTRGEVMVYKNRYVKGWFSASCGGETTSAKTGLAYKAAEPAYIQSVDCPERRVTPAEVKNWAASIDAERVLAALEKIGRPLPSLEQVQIARRTNNRAAVIRLSGGGKTVEVPGADFRVAVGPERMRSIWLTKAEVQGGKLEFAGTGFGHGVGMCQWGAYAFARAGRKPEAIVKHYYPKVEIRKLWQ